MTAQLDYELPYTLSDLTGTNLGPFSTEFTCEEVTDVEVYYWPPNDEPVLLTRDTQYTLSGSTPQINGYNITLVSVIGAAAWPSGAQLLRVRATEERQDSEFADNLGARPSVIGRLLNRLTRIAQEQRMQSDRAPKVPFGEIGPRFLREADRAGALIGYDEDGVTPVARPMAQFDADVAATAAEREAAEAARSAAETAREASETIKSQIDNRFENEIVPAIDQALEDIGTNKTEALEDIGTNKTEALDAIDTAKANALASVAADVEAAETARDQAVAATTDKANVIQPVGIVQNSAGAATTNALAIIAAFQRIPSGKRAVVQMPKDLTGTVYLDRNIGEQPGYGAVTFDQGGVTFAGGGVYVSATRTLKTSGTSSVEASYSSSPGTNDTHHQFEGVEVSSNGASYGKRFNYAKTGLAAPGFDVADSVQGYWLKTSNNAGSNGIGLNRWDICTIAPQASTNYPYAVNYEEINPINLHGNLNATLGLDRGAQTQGMGCTLIVAENRDFSGRHPGALAYPIYYAFATARAGLPGGDGKYTSIYYPFIAYQDSVTAGGVAFVSMGGTNINADGLYPRAHFMGQNTTQYGMDYSAATFTSSMAFRLAAGHQIAWADASYIKGDASTLSVNKDIYFDAAGKGLVGANGVSVVLNSSSDQAVTYGKNRSSTSWRRYAFNDVGGFDSDTTGAQYRGFAFVGPGYTDSGTQYGTNYQYFQYDNSAATVGFKRFVYNVNNAHTFSWEIDSAAKLRLSPSALTTHVNVAPDANATRDVGTSALRYNNIYLANNPNVSSDARLKRDIAPLDTSFALQMLQAIEPKTFKHVAGGADLSEEVIEETVEVPAQTQVIEHPAVYEETWVPPVLNVTTTPRIDPETGEQAFKDDVVKDEDGNIVAINRVFLWDTHTEVIEQARVERGELISEAWTETVELSPARTEIVKRVKEIVTPRAGARDHVGFIAQDVKAFLDAHGVDLALWGLADASDPDSKQQLRYEQFIGVLWAVIRELLARIEVLETQNGPA